MKNILILILSPQLLFAQLFTKMPQLPSFYSAESAIFYPADIDNDGDQDLAMLDPEGNTKLILFLNDGSGNFMESNSIPKIFGDDKATLYFTDIDNDGDQDFVYNIESEFSRITAQLYINDGAGNFDLGNIGMFSGVDYIYSYKLADIDGDKDLDAIVYGRLELYSASLFILYKNINTEIFELVDTFSRTRFSKLLFFDADSDGDEDLFAGDKLYKNDGLGNYSFMQQIDRFTKDVDVAYDFDFDGDNDLLLEGHYGDKITALVNDGTGYFNDSEKVETPFGYDIYRANTIVEDINQDGFKDAVFVNWNGSLSSYNITVYLNNQNTNYTHMQTLSFISFSSLSFFDFNNNGCKDLFLSRYFMPGPNPIARPGIFYNTNNESFTELKGPHIDGITDGEIEFADLDNDNDEDLIITGVSSYTATSTKMYINDGFGNFKISQNNFHYNPNSKVELADIDVMLSNGLYINNGRGRYTKDRDFPFENTFEDIGFSDIDLDGDQDLLGTKFLASGNSPYAMLFENDGNGNFNKIDNSYIINSSITNINFSHFNNDEYEDILITGYSSFYGYVTRVYINKGNKVFEETNTELFSKELVESQAIVDIDGDNDNDIVLGSIYGIKIYLNDGDANFHLSENNSLSGRFHREVFFEDMDDDGDQDILFGDNNNTYTYLNDGSGNFTPSYKYSLIDFNLNTAGFSDIDNDGDKDLLITGWEKFVAETRVSRLYKNNTYKNIPHIGDFNCK